MMMLVGTKLESLQGDLSFDHKVDTSTASGKANAAVTQSHQATKQPLSHVSTVLQFTQLYVFHNGMQEEASKRERKYLLGDSTNQEGLKT